MDRAARVLVVDENADHRNILATLLGHHQYEAVLRTTPDEGFAAAVGERPDAVLVALLFGGLPVGLELIDRLRAEPATADIPIVVVSSFTDMHDDDLRSRGVKFVPKGGELHRVIDMLRSVLRPGPSAA